MSINSICRYFPLNYRFNISINRSFSTSSIDETNYYKLLQTNNNLEKTLTKNRGKLNSSIVEQVLRKCSSDKPILGLRFFIWAGLQSDYRHSKFIYNKACNFFEIERIISDVLEIYRKEGCLVCVKMFKVILNLCREAKLANEALGVFRKMREFGCRPDTTSFNIVIRIFCEKGDMDVVLVLMKEMALIGIYPDMITYVVSIKGFCEVGRLEDACGLVKVMRDQGCVPNVVAYSALLDGFCKIGDFDKAMELLGEMEKEENGGMPNVITYTSLIQNFCDNDRTVEALAVLDRMGSRGCFPNRVTISTLIRRLCSDDNIEEAHKLIEKVVANGSVSRNECYSCLVVSLLRNKNMSEANELFRWMLKNQIKPDGLASSILIKQLCLDGQILKGFEYYDEMEKIDCLPSIDSNIYSILLVGLCQHGYLVEAVRLINAMVKRKIKVKASYTDSLIKSLQNSGEKELALHLKSVQESCCN